MKLLPTLGALSITDGRLMSDIGDVYAVVSFFIGRDAYTHELGRRSGEIKQVLLDKYPDLLGDRETHWEIVRDRVVGAYGDNLEAEDSWKGMFYDGKNAVETLEDALSES